MADIIDTAAEIEEARRRAMPGCRMCASCQADAEIRGKHRR